jgi:DNA-binding response OmpR family regulator
MTETDNGEREGLVLVVDDDASTRALHSGILARHFEVICASSGAEALALCEERRPDLILLDVRMPVFNGFETCARIRERSEVPIIFATVYDSLEEHLKAYDAGGTDLCVKPVSAQIMIRKVRLGIAKHREREALKAEKASLHFMAMGFLSTMGENGVLLQFARASLGCRSYEALAQNFVEAANNLGVDCCVAIRHDELETCWSKKGPATALELSVLGHVSKMGRLTQFRNRLAINYDKVSVVVSNLPTEPAELVGRMRDNMMVLAETTEALAESVDVRLESAARAEQMQVALGDVLRTVEDLRDKHRLLVADVRMLLQSHSDEVRANYAWLSADRIQEEAMNREVINSVDRILQVLLRGVAFEEDFARISASLSRHDRNEDFELF